MDKIIVLGDSFTYGHGCSDRIYYYDPVTKTKVGSIETVSQGPSDYCWPKLLSNNCEFEVINLSIPGNSNQGMFKDFKKYIEKNSFKDIKYVFFCASYIDRIEIASFGEADQTVPWVIASTIPEKQNQQIDNAKRSFIKFLYNKELAINYTLTSLLSVFSLSKENNIQFFYSLPFFVNQELKSNKEIFNLLSSYQIPSINDLNFLSKSDHANRNMFLAPDGHVNEKAHREYFERVISSVVRKK